MQSSPPHDAAQDVPPPAPAPSPAPEGGLRARLARFSPYFGNQRLAWFVAIAATIAGAATEPLIPALLKPLLDHGFTERDLPLWTVPVAIVGIFFIRGLAQFAGQYALARIANDGMQKLRQSLFERILVADMALFSRKTASALSNAVVYEVQTGAMLLVQALLGISRDGFTLLALLGYLIYLNWQLTLIIAVMVPGVGWIMKTLSGRVYRLTQSSQEATDELAYVVEENVLAHRMVRLHGAQASQGMRFARLSQRLRQLAIKSTIASAATTPLTQLLAAVALSAVICIALWQSQGAMANREVTVGGFVAFIAAMLMLIAPIRRMADIASPITRGVAALERGLALLDEAGTESGGSYATPRAQGALTLQDVSVRFDPERAPALEHVSLSVQPGEVVALVGPSGAGKTTLVNLLPRFIDPTSGQVLLDGHALPEWRLDALRAQFAMVSQDVVMFNDSIAANVALGACRTLGVDSENAPQRGQFLPDSPPHSGTMGQEDGKKWAAAAHSQPTTPKPARLLGQDVDEQRVQACLTAANLGDYVAALPQGIHTLVGHNATQLSGGQRQRLAIARALYKDAPILILDEATSALDTESERLVQDALQRLMQGRTTLVIAHRLSTIEHADRLIVMDRGRVVEQGTHAELLARGGLYARLQTRPAGQEPEQTGQE